MFSSSADILNLALAGGFVFIAVFLCVALWHLILLLRDIGETARVARRVAEQLESLVLQPLAFLGMAIGQVGNVLGMLENLGFLGEKKKRGRKK